MKKAAAFAIVLLFLFSALALQIAQKTKSNGYGDYPPPANADWIIWNDTYVGNETLVIEKNITVQSGATLTLQNVTLRMNSTTATGDNNRIEVLSGGTLVIRDGDGNNSTTKDASRIMRNDPNYGYLFTAWTGSHLRIYNSIIEGCGRISSPLQVRGGIYIETDDAIVDHCIISNGTYYGIILYGSDAVVSNNTIEWCDNTGIRATTWSNGTIENNRINGSRTYGIRIDGWDNIKNWDSNPTIKGNWVNETGRSAAGGVGIQIESSSSPTLENNYIYHSTEDSLYMWYRCNPIIKNCTFAPNGGNFGIVGGGGINIPQIINSTVSPSVINDLNIGGSYFDLLNSTFNKSSVGFSDSTSNLTVRWFLHTYVNDTLGNPVPNATIRIQDNANGTFDQNFTTDANGFVNWTVLTEYYQNQSTTILYTPYNVTVSKNGYNPGYANVMMDQSKYITITLNATPAVMGLNVTSGWNLISVPLVQGNTTLPYALLDLSGDTTWDHIQWYDPLDSANHWKQYYTNWSSSLNDLTNVNRTIGIWLNITSVGDGILNISGYLPTSTSINLYSGWNLIGYPARDDSNYTDGQLKAATGATIVENFDAAATYKTKVLSDGYVMKRGEAYWVYLPADTVWTVDW